jgi:hypothetical protein
LVYNIAAGKVIEHRRSYRMLNKHSVFMMLLIVTTSLVEISSIYQPAGAEMQLLQLPPIPPLLPPGGPPIQAPPS